MALSTLWFFIGLAMVSWFLEKGQIRNWLGWIITMAITAFAIAVIEELLYGLHKKRKLK